jgi:hypothetical protein
MSTRYPASTALAPTRRKENILGYDVDVRELLGVVFQFKRPSEIQARTHPTQLPKPTNAAIPVRFETNIEQWITLISGFNLSEAFYAIPPVLDGSDLYKSLKQTVFVDIYGVLPQTSLLYTVPDGCSYSGGRVLVEGKIKGGSTYQVPPAFVYCFDDIRTGLSSSWLGLQFYEAVEPDGQLDPEQSLEEQRRATEELSEFESRVKSLSSPDNEIEEYRVRDALQNATWRLQELSNSDFGSDTLGPIHAELADTHDLSPTERWKRIFLNINRDGPYETDQVASTCEEIDDVADGAFDELRDDLISETDTPPATQLLQRADAEMCMLGRE